MGKNFETTTAYTVYAIDTIKTIDAWQSFFLPIKTAATQLTWESKANAFFEWLAGCNQSIGTNKTGAFETMQMNKNVQEENKNVIDEVAKAKEPSEFE